MTYYKLNIKHPLCNAPAAYWLRERELAPVFFGTVSVAGLQQQKGGGPLFGSVGENDDLRRAARVVTISEGIFWAYELAGVIYELSDEPLTHGPMEKKVTDIPKVIAIKNLKELPLREVPLILASMNANQHFSRGTFVEIGRDASYIGNVAALDRCWGGTPRGASRLQCLSSIELETLVAKILEAHGAFVPAYKGGFLKGIDLFAYSSAVDLCGLPSTRRVNGESASTVQVKLHVTDTSAKELEDWLNQGLDRCVITAEDVPCKRLAKFHGSQYFTRDWIDRALDAAPVVNAWLRRSTAWLPAD